MMALPIIASALGCRGSSVPAEVPVPAVRGVEIEPASPPDPITRVVAGPRSTCAVTQGGQVACWGQQSVGTHVPVRAALPPVSDLAAGDRTFCAATRSEGDVWCWGSGAYALGRPSEATDLLKPEPVPLVRGVDELVHRQGRTCARNPDGEAWCWGEGEDKPLLVPAPSSAGPLVLDDEGRLCAQHPLRCGEKADGVFERVWPIDEVGWSYEASEASCSLDEQGRVTCRGNMAELVESEQPPATASGSLQVGAKHVCGLDSASVAWCRGEDDMGQRGSPETLGPVRSLAVGSNHTCVVTEDHRLLCWGSALEGQVGAPVPALKEPEPVEAVLDAKPTGLVQFGEQVCVRTDAGIACPSADCGKARFVPTAFQRAEVGAHGETCLFTPGGKAHCKNPLTRGELVWPEADARSVAMRLAQTDELWCVQRGRITPCDTAAETNDGSLRGISTGLGAACGVTRGGSLQCWLGGSRENAAHRFEGDFSSVDVPQRLARRSDGAFVWIDTDEGRLVEIPVPGLSRVSSDGSSTACGIDGDGSAWCWSAAEGKAERVNAKTRFVDLLRTDKVSCAIDENAKLWCWGSADVGQLGNGIALCASSPLDLTEQVHRALPQTSGGA